MKTATVRFTAVAVLLLVLAIPLSVLADGVTGRGGPIVSWDRIEGTIIRPDETAMQVGPFFAASLRFRAGGEGSAVLFTSSGYFFMQIKGLAWGEHYSNGPLGAGLTGTFVGTIVCDSVPDATATYQSVDTPKIQMDQGSAYYFGVLDLPQTCRDAPEKIVFLLRHDPDLTAPSIAGKFVAYGAGRVIR